MSITLLLHRGRDHNMCPMCAGIHDPDVGAIFLYREPLGILKSHQKSRGRHMVPDLLKKDVFNIRNVPAYDLDQYATTVLFKLFEG